MAKRIPLSRGEYTLVSDEDFERVNRYKWSCDKNGYAVRKVITYPNGKRRQRKIMMHRYILRAPDGVLVDHANHDTLDNRRENLRLATQSQNNANSAPKPGARSQYKGVVWQERSKRWYARVCFNGLKIHLGSFTDEADAGRAYDRVAHLVWGEFAFLNFPDELPHDVTPDDVYPTLSPVSQMRLRAALTTNQRVA